jgi:hypothetical protein
LPEGLALSKLTFTQEGGSPSSAISPPQLPTPFFRLC